ncbi:MAG: methionyl-tRNA formyltransferase [Candidatus Limnocylindrales bacterium]|nr:methionyl-tRNA formyltransferase [Candidatus Limnocylindrales bacterium]
MKADRRPSGERVRTLFLGSGAFAVTILEALVTAPEVRLVGVVSAPDRPSGRRAELTPVPVARRARELDLPLLQPASLRAPDAVAEIAALQPDLGVLADYGQIVPPSVLAIAAHGILNVHPSALPRHRGATPIPATIVAGDPMGAVTLIRMDEGLDTGPIVAQETWALDGTETTETLEAEAARRGANLLRRSLGAWLAGALPAAPQAEAGATLTRPLRREDGRLDPALTAAELERRVRAHVPWPGSFVDTRLGRLIVREAEAVPGVPGDTQGTLVADDAGLALTTASGRLRLKRAQLAGRRATDAASLRRGAPGLVGQTVALR